MATLTYQLHGLRIRSEIALHERVCSPAEPADVRITLDRAAGAGGEPDGDLVAQLAAAGRAFYQVFRCHSGAHLLRVGGICDFEISPDAAEITCRPYPAVDAEWIQILLRGTVAGLLLDLRGQPSLHASAIEIGGRVIAFAGGSGAGKTTTAAMFCTAGARLVTDDVLSVEFDEMQPRCRLGSIELRLREAAAPLVQDPSWVVAHRRLVDGRLAVRPKAAGADRAPLQAVVFPRPDRRATHPTLTRVRPPEAAIWLAEGPRICWWNSPEAVERAFIQATRVAGKVPVYEAAIPWGPPWRASPAMPLLEVLAEAAA